jgi:dienelactone hydrolase
MHLDIPTVYRLSSIVNRLSSRVMATPTLSRHQLPGALGPILVDVRTANRASPQPAVVLHHGFKGFKDYAFFPPFAERLARAGFSAVTLSVSGAGVDPLGNFAWPERFARNTYTRELDDLARVLRAVAEGSLGFAPPSSVGLLGHSRGGGVALLSARETPAVTAVATWAAIGSARRHSEREVELWRKAGSIPIPHQRLGITLSLDYEVVEDFLEHEHGRFDIHAAAGALRRPWLLVHGTEDETVPVAEGRALAERGDPDTTEVVFVEGATHTFGARHPWAGETPHLQRTFDVTTSFFSRHLS